MSQARFYSQGHSLWLTFVLVHYYHSLLNHSIKYYSIIKGTYRSFNPNSSFCKSLRPYMMKGKFT